MRARPPTVRMPRRPAHHPKGGRRFMDDPRCTRVGFKVVAMAASAGGLNALSLVLSQLPPGFPAAIVVVQHLDPRRPSMMADILGRRTALPVRQAAEGDALRPGTV